MTALQKRFCEEYVIDLHASQAAIRAGYSKKTAYSKASVLLDDESIRKYIAELQADIAKRNSISADMVVQELAALGFYSIQDVIDDDMAIINLKKTDRSKVKPVIGIEITEIIRGTGKRRKKTVQTKVKLADKTNALIHLGKHLGIFKEDNNQKSIKIKVTRK